MLFMSLKLYAAVTNSWSTICENELLVKYLVNWSPVWHLQQQLRMLLSKEKYGWVLVCLWTLGCMDIQLSFILLTTLRIRGWNSTAISLLPYTERKFTWQSVVKPHGLQTQKAESSNAHRITAFERSWATLHSVHKGATLLGSLAPRCREE